MTPIVLDQREGWALIDQALKNVDVERMGATALVKEILDELTPGLDDGCSFGSIRAIR